MKAPERNIAMFFLDITAEHAANGTMEIFIEELAWQDNHLSKHREPKHISVSKAESVFFQLLFVFQHFFKIDLLIFQSIDLLSLFPLLCRAQIENMLSSQDVSVEGMCIFETRVNMINDVH